MAILKGHHDLEVIHGNPFSDKPKSITRMQQQPAKTTTRISQNTHHSFNVTLKLRQAAGKVGIAYSPTVSNSVQCQTILP